MVRRWGPVVVLWAMVAAYVAVFGTLTWRQQANYGTFGFDMGIHDQGIWLTSQFTEPFVTVRGMNYFGHHVNLVALLYAPAYWLGAGPHFLYLTETVALALGAVPLWLLARLRLGSGRGGDAHLAAWWALVPAGAWLLHPSVQWINWWHWHPEAMAITPLLFAWWFAVRKRWRWFGLCVGLALLCKEDVALAVAFLGVTILVVRSVRVRGAGVMTMMAGVAWFVACTRAVIPAILGTTPFYERELFPEWGTSLPSVLWAIVTSPGKLLSTVFESGRVEYYGKLLGPFGVFAPATGFPLLLVGAPQTGVNVLSSLPGTYDIRFQYSSMVLVGVALASVEGLGRLHAMSTARWARLLAGAATLTMAFGAIAGNTWWSPSPLADEFHSGIWARRIPRHDVFDRAVAMVPDDASVSASYYLIPHLTHRRAAYEWPNPWELVNWGLSGEDAPPPSSVEWLVLDRTLGQEEPLLAGLIVDGGEFEVVLDEDMVLVARRVRPPDSGVPERRR